MHIANTEMKTEIIWMITLTDFIAGWFAKINNM